MIQEKVIKSRNLRVWDLSTIQKIDRGEKMVCGDSPLFSKELQGQFFEIKQNYDKAQNAFLKDDYEHFNDYFSNTLKSLYHLAKNPEFEYRLIRFRKAYFNPLQTESGVYGAGLSYKAKIWGKGKNKEMAVKGAMPSDTQLKKELRLSKLEQERLVKSLFVDIGLNPEAYHIVALRIWFENFMQGMNKNGTLHTLQYDESLRPYKKNRILRSDTITQAKAKIQLVNKSCG